jgi:hypothetical protein
MCDLEFFDAPFRQQVLGQAGIDVIVFNQENANHRAKIRL